MYSETTQAGMAEWIKGKYVAFTPAAARRYKKVYSRDFNPDFAYRVAEAIWIPGYAGFVYHFRAFNQQGLAVGVRAEYVYVLKCQQEIKKRLTLMRPRKRIDLDG